VLEENVFVPYIATYRTWGFQFNLQFSVCVSFTVFHRIILKKKSLFSKWFTQLSKNTIFTTIVRSTMSDPIQCNIVCKSFSFSFHKLSLFISNFWSVYIVLWNCFGRLEIITRTKGSGRPTKRTPEVVDAVKRK
jgi:hypothetical protein